jgi:hypothetical protein
MKRHLCLTSILLCLCACLYAQGSDSSIQKIRDFPNRLFYKIRTRACRLDNQLDKQTEKYLSRLAHKEARLKKKLYAYDSSAAEQLFASSPEQQYAQLAQKLKSDSAGALRSMGPEYLPYADSLNGMLGFLKSNPQLLNGTIVLPDNLQQTFNQYRQLTSKLQDADMIKQFIQSRKAQIQACLAKYSNLPGGFSSIVQSYNKEIYYYSEQVRQYRAMLNDPDKMMQTALALLNKLPAFSQFMASHSFLAGLFNVPSNYATVQGMEGLQSRDQVMTLIQNQIGQGGSNGSSFLQQSLQSASQDINKLHDKLSALGGGSGDINMPNFKPNNQKTKPFLKRLELGTNFQTAHTNYYFPTTTDIGLSVGYKISDKTTIGIGLSYKNGWGRDFRHINMSSQGASLRTYADLKAKKSFYLSGGFECNYQPIPGIYLGTLSSWSKSGLIGMSKIVSMKTKVFKNTKLSLLWDFLSYEQVPRTQPFVFRVGYSFK